MPMSKKQMSAYIKRRGWYSFQSPNNWMNDELMDDMTLDGPGLSLKEAYLLQRKILVKQKAIVKT